MQTQIKNAKNHTEIVEQLREEAKKHPAFEAMCLWFAVRERTRSQITLRTLKLVMTEHGFEFEDRDLQKELEFMANLGLAKIDYDPGGKFRGIKDIKFTLQDVGLAALNKEDKKGVLRTYKQAKSFSKLSRPEVRTEAVLPAPIRENIKKNELMIPARLILTINGQDVEVPLPPVRMPPENMVVFVNEALNLLKLSH